MITITAEISIRVKAVGERLSIKEKHYFSEKYSGLGDENKRIGAGFKFFNKFEYGLSCFVQWLRHVNKKGIQISLNPFF